MVFGKMRSSLYDRRNKKRQDQDLRAGQRAMQYEERIRNATGINVLKECLKENENEATKTRNTLERREYIMRNEYSQAGIDQLRERNVNVAKSLKEEIRKCKNKLNTTK